MLQTKKLSQFAIITFSLAIFFLGYYLAFFRLLPIAYWDESLWIGRSYFFDSYVAADFQNPLWESYQSYDQPKLTELLFGLWLMPGYLQEKATQTQIDYDYKKYLIDHGFYEFDDDDDNYGDPYESYARSSGSVKLVPAESGYPDELLEKYGSKVWPLLDTVFAIRLLNVFLLVGSVLCVFWIFSKVCSVRVAAVTALVYGINSLLVQAGLVAQSEALFLATFHLSLVMLFKYLDSDYKIKWLIFFSIAAGLCWSTKLNGIMTLIIFGGVVFYDLFSRYAASGKLLKQLGLHVLIASTISVAVFTALNPFTFANPVRNIPYMFEWRATTVMQYQVPYSAEGEYLPNPLARLMRFGVNFFGRAETAYYNQPFSFELAMFGTWWNVLCFVFFVVGIYELISNKGRFPRVFLVIALITIIVTSFYLILDWPRYYVHLIVFVVAFQASGVVKVIRLFLETFTNKSVLLRRFSLLKS